MNGPKALIVAGLVLCAAGALWWAAQKLPGLDRLGRLPGDVHVEGPRGSFHFPWVTSLVVSLALTLILNLILYFTRNR